MTRPITWVEHNAGFEPGVYDTGRRVERPNAQVVALALFEKAIGYEDTTYRSMFNLLSADFQEWAHQPGRASVNRRFFRTHAASLHSYRMPKEFYKPWIENRYRPEGLEWVTTNWIGSPIKLHLDDGVFGEEPHTVLARLSADELIPVIDGVAHYPYDPNHRVAPGRGRMVYGYWTLP